MITLDVLQQAENILGHPLGLRKTDDKLARAAVQRHLGRRASSTPIGDSLAEGMLNFKPRTRAARARAALQRITRRWRLYRAQQVDQDDHPACVGATEEHWEKSLPVYNRKGLGFLEMYRRAKLIDPWPGEDGTDAASMLKVCTELGIVESTWWWTGPQDTEPARQWVRTIGPLWFGAGWAESMFRTDDHGVVPVEGELIYGHEVLVIGHTSNFQGHGPAWEIAQSWGIDNFGIRGRGWILDPDFDRLMAEGGDLVGVGERLAT